ncbi:MAG TPA: GAF domain-containing sensor histidine kinase [Anaerolineales bacterium]|nr:GAF domain-containing sensor histidine kinase [Anaerolineales bacterium]
MSSAIARLTIWSLAALTAALSLAGLVASIMAVVATGKSLGLYTHQLTLPLIAIVFAILGPLVLTRHPRHLVGWIMAITALFSGIVVLNVGLRAYGEEVLGPARAGWLPLMQWLDLWVWIPTNVLPFAFLILLFPDGRLPSPRWRPVAWAAGVGMVATMLGSALNPVARMDAEDQLRPNPFGIQGAGPAMDVLLNAGGLLLLIAFVGSIVALVLRFRRSSGIDRQQLKWLAYATVLLVVSIVLSAVVYAAVPQDNLGAQASILLTSLALLGIPLAASVAILRYRLYDIDLIIYRTVLYGLLTASVIVLYVALVMLMGLLFQTQTGWAGALVATGIVAVLFQPLRERLQKAVSRLLYGERDEPYAVLTRLSRRLRATLEPEQALQTIVDTVAQALKLPFVAIALAEATGFRIVGEFGRPSGEPLILPMVYQGDTVGRLMVSWRGPNEPFGRSEVDLLEDIAQQAGAAAHTVRLTRDLQRSRERLVTAREEERRRLRRELHDGLGPELASLSLKLGAARNLIPRAPDRADAVLAELTAQVQGTLAGIRRLAYDLRPPALDELGLVPAVRESASSQAEGGPRVVVEAPDSLPDLPAAVEVAAYRIATEAVTNVARHANADHVVVRFDLTDALELTIQDDGGGIPAKARAGVGITSMRERAAELGGRVDVEAVPGGGTRVRARLPLLLAEG